MQRNTLVRTGLSLLAMLLLSQAFMAVASAQWDFPRLDEILFKIKYPAAVSLAAAQACEIDTYVGAISTVELETLRDPPYDWSVTASPGFHMNYIGINCRDVTPDTSGSLRDYHSRQPGFQLYPLNLTAFRYALELIVGCSKTVWINNVYGYINVRLDTTVPPANVFWYNPSITPYPLDWDEAYYHLTAAGFSGTIGGDDWLMPNGEQLREPIYVLSPLESPTAYALAEDHVRSWNQFFCGLSVAKMPHTCNFVWEELGFYEMLDIVFYDRDHDMYSLSWELDREPDYLWDLFHPDADVPGGTNSPGLDYRPLNAMLDAFKFCMWTEKTELRMYAGPMTVPEGTVYYTDYPIAPGSEDLWVGVYSGAGGYPYRVAELENGTDYTYVTSAGKNVGIHFLRDIALADGMYVHIVHTLENQVPINNQSDLQQVCYEIQWMLYFMCPYLPIYSRVIYDLYKPGLESWVTSLGYGSAAYQLKWTYGSIHWTGTPVGGTVNWHLPGPVNTFHPWLSASVYEKTVLNRLYDNMLEVDAYTHSDIPMCAIDYRIYDWTGPSGEPGMRITWWIRDDLYWQDGDHVTADDFIWDYEFINSIQPAQLYSVWGYYNGCEKHNDYCFSIYVNTTGLWNFHAYTRGPTYPRKIWEPYWGDIIAAEAFQPWLTPHPTVPGMTCLYGTGEWIFDYYDAVLGIVRVYKNPNWWGRLAAQPCRQIAGVYAPTIGGKDDIPKVTKAVVGLYNFNLDTKEGCAHTWTLKADGYVVASGSRTLVALGSLNWYQPIPWNLGGTGWGSTPVLRMFRLETTNAYGTNYYEIQMYVLVGDIDNNNIIGFGDLYMLSYALDSFPGHPRWNPNADLNNDDKVDTVDLNLWYWWHLQSGHDVAVTNVVTSKTIVGQGYSAKVNVTVANQGPFPENVSLSVRLGSNEVKRDSVYVESATSTTAVLIAVPRAFAFEEISRKPGGVATGNTGSLTLYGTNTYLNAWQGFIGGMVPVGIVELYYSNGTLLKRYEFVSPSESGTVFSAGRYGEGIYALGTVGGSLCVADDKGEFGQLSIGAAPINDITIEGSYINLSTTNEDISLRRYSLNFSLSKGYYTISALANFVLGEIETEDNTFVDGSIRVGTPGNVNGDSIVNMIDLYLLALAYGTAPGHPKYISDYDIDNNEIINMLDLYIAAIHFGETDP